MQEEQPRREDGWELGWMEWMGVAGVGLVGVWMMWMCRLCPGGGWGGVFAAMLFLPGAGMTLLGLLGLWVWRCVRVRERWGARVKGMLPVVVTVGIVACVLWMSARGVPFRAAFWWSRGALERVAAEVRPGVELGRREAGSWTIDRAEVEDGEVRLHMTEGVGDFDGWFVKAEKEPGGGRFMRVERVGEGWWLGVR